jgi:hypothetical protein
MQSFFYSGFSKRDYFTIDYSNIPISLTGIDSSTDGWTNTQNISTMDIAQDICPFERDIQNTKKTIQGNGGVELFYLVGSEPDDDTKYSKIWDKKVDESDSESGIISYILKKNPYKVNGKLSDDYNSITYYVTITHLRWYLPACEQNNFPEGEPLGEYWSSTSTGDNSSYLLNGTAALRTEVHNVRAIRNRDSN